MSTTVEHQYSRPADAPVELDTVAILGAGRVGTALARGLVQAGYDVRVAGSGSADRIRLIVDVIAPGARALDAREAIDGADVVILAMPLHKARTVDASILAGKIVVDLMNYWEPVDGELPEFARAPRGTSPVVQAMFPGARIVKAFNHIGYHDLEGDRRLAGSPDRRAAAVAGDDADAVAIVAEMIERLGFDAVRAGGLDEGVRLEAGGGAFGVRLGRDALEALLGR